MEGKASWVLTLVAAMFLAMTGSSHGYDFYVGGRQGWVPSPSESYTDWAGRNRFQVNDRLVFRYKQGEDSVLVVSEADYRACNTSNPIRKLDGGGDSVFQFDRSGPFYFISGVPGRCQAGEKLVVVVLAVRGGRPKPGAPPLPAAAPSPLPSPPRGAPSPAFPSPPPAGAGGPGPAAPTGAPPTEAAPGPSDLPPPSSQPPSGSPSPGVPVAALALAAGATFLFI